jgi:NAD(P)H-nitrite reductase large subunit
MTSDRPRCICRCEEVSEQALLTAIEASASSLNDLKRRTRAGMGLCQGAYCLPEMAEMLAARTGQPLAAIPPMTMRPPVGGVTLTALAAAVPAEE